MINNEFNNIDNLNNLNEEEIQNKKFVGLNLKDFYQTKNKTEKNTQSKELEIVDFNEFYEFRLEDDDLENLRDNEYKKNFKFNSYYETYSLEFKKVLYIADPQCEYIIFKPLSHFFFQDDFPLKNKLLIYQIDLDKICLTLLDDKDIIDEIYEEYLDEISEFLKQDSIYSNLKFIDVSEFVELSIDSIILNSLQDTHYENTFNLKSKYSNYQMEFEKVFYDGDDIAQYVLLKPLTHIFIETNDFTIKNNLLAYEIDSEKMTLNLIQYEDIICGLIDDYFYSLNEKDEENFNDNNSEEVIENYSNNNEDISVPFEKTEDPVEKLLTENYNDPIILKNIHGEKMIIKRVGSIVYKKKDYLIAKVLKKENSSKTNVYVVYNIVHDADFDYLKSVLKERLSKKILKLYSKQNKIKLV